MNAHARLTQTNAKGVHDMLRQRGYRSVDYDHDDADLVVIRAAAGDLHDVRGVIPAGWHASYRRGDPDEIVVRRTR